MVIIQTTKQLRPRDKADHYPTPLGLCRAATCVIPVENPQRILDPGAGSGVWGRAANERWQDAKITGVEMDQQRIKVYPYWQWLDMDFLNLIPHATFDIILGNPPYGRNSDGERDRNLAEKFVRHSWNMLKDEGYICFLLRLAFLEGQKRSETFWPEFPLKELYVLNRRPSFTNNGKTDSTAYGLFVWQKGYTGSTELKWLQWNYDNAEISGHQTVQSVP